MKKIKNPFGVGDIVRLKKDVKDTYSETWHDKGDIQAVDYIASDGVGLMFTSGLGTHFTNVKLVKKALRCKCCGQMLK